MLWLSPAESEGDVMSIITDRNVASVCVCVCVCVCDVIYIID